MGSCSPSSGLLFCHWSLSLLLSLSVSLPLLSSSQYVSTRTRMYAAPAPARMRTHTPTGAANTQQTPVHTCAPACTRIHTRTRMHAHAQVRQGGAHSDSGSNLVSALERHDLLRASEAPSQLGHNGGVPRELAGIDEYLQSARNPRASLSGLSPLGVRFGRGGGGYNAHQCTAALCAVLH